MTVSLNIQKPKQLNFAILPLLFFALMLCHGSYSPRGMATKILIRLYLFRLKRFKNNVYKSITKFLYLFYCGTHSHLNKRTVRHLGYVTTGIIKPFKAPPKYLPTVKHCLKPFQPGLKSETLTVRAILIMGVYRVSQKKNSNFKFRLNKDDLIVWSDLYFILKLVHFSF